MSDCSLSQEIRLWLCLRDGLGAWFSRTGLLNQEQANWLGLTLAVIGAKDLRRIEE